jgi:hypothetical protein
MVFAAVCAEIAYAENQNDSGRIASPATAQETQKGKNCFRLFDASAVGHSWANAYLLALASHYTYPEKLDAPPGAGANEFERRYREAFKPWGIDTFDFVYGSGRDVDTEVVVMSPREGDFIVVVFRGSENLLQDPVGAFKDGVLTDANCGWKDVSEQLGEGVKAHEGFWNAFFPIRNAVSEAIERQGGFSPEKKLWITGNSLGGALANLCALWLRKEGHAVQGVYTYGAPRCGDSAFRSRYENDYSIMCQRWVNDNDIVPLLPPPKLFPDYCHVGVTNNIKSDGSVILDDVEYDGLGNPIKHYQEFYAYRIYNLLPPEIRRLMPPPPALPALARPFM